MGWAWCVSRISIFHMFFLPHKAVGFETSCVYCVVYVFFKTKFVLLFRVILYKLLQCPENPWRRFSVLPIRALKIISNRNCISQLDNLIRVSYCFWDICWHIICAMCQGLFSVFVLVVHTAAQYVGLNTYIKPGWDFTIWRYFVSPFKDILFYMI